MIDKFTTTSIVIFLCMAGLVPAEAQTPACLRSTTATGGGVMVTRYRQQPLRSTGQAGISGRTTKDRIQLFQGFIQPFIVTAPAAPEYLRIEVYPNPFYQDLHLEMAEDAGSVLITITDMTGRTLLKHEAEPRARHLLQPILPAGTYILQVRSVRGSFSTKIIKH